MEVYKSNYLTITSEEGSPKINFVWSDETEKLTDDIFRGELLEQTKAIKELVPKFVFLDTRKFVFPILPETQSWVDIDIYPVWAEIGITRIAIVMSAELIAQLSIEQAFDENTQEEMTSRFFDNPEEALDWFSEA